MKTVAIMPVRNEAWCIGITLRALLLWVDEVCLTLHNCTDETHDIVCQIMQETDGQVFMCTENTNVWAEMAQRDRLLKFARGRGATHVAITDADELVSGNLLPTIRQMVEQTPRGAILQLPWVQLKGSIGTYISTGMWSQQCASTAFPDDPAYCWKPQVGDYQHHHRHPMGKPINCHMPMGRSVKAGGCLHLQMSNLDRLRWKQLKYKLDERSRWPNLRTPAELNKMYDPTVIDAGALSPVPAEWLAPYAPLMHHLHLDAEPWQRAEVLRMVAEDANLLDGLTTYGLEL